MTTTSFNHPSFLALDRAALGSSSVELRAHIERFDGAFRDALDRVDGEERSSKQPRGDTGAEVMLDEWLFAAFGGSLGHTFMGSSGRQGKSMWLDSGIMSQLRLFFARTVELNLAGAHKRTSFWHSGLR